MGTLDEHAAHTVDVFVDALSGLPLVVRIDAERAGLGVQFRVVVSSAWHEGAPAVERALAPIRDAGVLYRYSVSQAQWAPPPSEKSVFVRNPEPGQET